MIKLSHLIRVKLFLKIIQPAQNWWKREPVHKIMIKFKELEQNQFKNCWFGGKGAEHWMRTYHVYNSTNILTLLFSEQPVITHPGYFVVFIFNFLNTLLSLEAQSVWIL